MFAVLCLIFVGMQLTSPSRTNPSIDETKTLFAMTDVPVEVSAALTRSCNNCHSNRTEWPWYSHIAPVSWFTVGHVNDARSELNFSEWGNYGERMKQTRLAALCGLVREEQMPLPSYLILHSEVRLSTDERKMICDWTEVERGRLAAKQPAS